MTDPNWDIAKVRAFGERLLATPGDAIKLAKNLLWKGDTYAAGAAVMSEFQALSPWEQAGVVDELRNALDRQLHAVFDDHVKVAREHQARHAEQAGAAQ